LQRHRWLRLSRLVLPAERGRRRRLLQRHDLELPHVAGKAVDLQTGPFEVDGLSSFGENASGELFAVSLDGTIFRLS
jgi:hypothetical protein